MTEKKSEIGYLVLGCTFISDIHLTIGSVVPRGQGSVKKGSNNKSYAQKIYAQATRGLLAEIEVLGCLRQNKGETATLVNVPYEE